jgi:hypothetical protein
MCYLSKYPNIRYILAEDTNYGKTEMFPIFYLGQWDTYVYNIKPSRSVKTFMQIMEDSEPGCEPRFVLFYGDEKLDKRLDSVKMCIPHLEYETIIEPSFIDDLLYRMNPRNSNQTIYIYRNLDYFPAKL